MKKLIITLYICIIAVTGFSQTFSYKQTLLPLSNVNGVPFFKDPELNDLVINGFEVDAKGFFYFFGGKSPRLAVFNGNKQIYRKSYKGLISGTELHSFNGKFYNYAFDSKGNLTFITINMADGRLDYLKSPLLSKHFTSGKIVDSCVILRIPAENSNVDSFDEYNLSGKFLKKVTNEYGIPAYLFPDKKDDESIWELAGKWNENYVFWTTNSESSKYEKLCLVSKDGKILSTKLLPFKVLGKGYAENPDEDRKVRNGSFFVLGRKGNNALITEIPLKGLFGE